VGLDELDFEILTPGSRGVLGMGAEPARVLAAPRSALGGAAPKREAAAQVPLAARVMIGRSARGATVTLATTAIVDRARPGTTTEDPRVTEVHAPPATAGLGPTAIRAPHRG